MKIFVRGIGIFFSLLGVWVLIEYEQSLSRTGLPRETQSHIAVVVLVSISYFSSCINHSRKFSRFLASDRLQPREYPVVFYLF